MNDFKTSCICHEFVRAASQTGFGVLVNSIYIQHYPKEQKEGSLRTCTSLLFEGFKLLLSHAAFPQ